MKTKKRLEEYFEYTGVQKNWFARKIGMPRSMLYRVVAGILPIPRKYWPKMIEFSQGFVKSEHLIADHLEHHFQDFPLVEIQEMEGEGKWIISAKILETKQ